MRTTPIILASGATPGFGADRRQLLHIGIGRAHAGARVLLLVNDLDVRVITEDGELLRHLTPDPTRDYQPRGRL